MTVVKNAKKISRGKGKVYMKEKIIVMLPVGFSGGSTDTSRME